MLKITRHFTFYHLSIYKIKKHHGFIDASTCNGGDDELASLNLLTLSLCSCPNDNSSK
uniref:Uncharacterized protein n=1 Tax=Rhizophagus irregularis (strain DAOM 181602 / DAOM 197198 / MUCL 43194) TaxID=747089 RepID=U9UHZ1_RHIID